MPAGTDLYVLALECLTVKVRHSCASTYKSVPVVIFGRTSEAEKQYFIHACGSVVILGGTPDVKLVRELDDARHSHLRVIYLTYVSIPVNMFERTSEAEKLARELHDARHSQLRASSQFERANEKMDNVNGDRALLQVKVGVYESWHTYE